MNIETEQIIRFSFSDKLENKVEKDGLFKFLGNSVSGLIGFGNYKYDYQLLHKILKTFTVDTYALYGLSNLISERIAELVYEKDFIIPQLDLAKINELDKKFMNLGDMSFFVNYRRIVNRPFPGKDVVTDDEIKDVMLYGDDCVRVIRYMNMYSKSKVSFRRSVCKKYGIKVMNKPDNDVGYYIFLSKYLKLTGKTFEDIKGLKNTGLSWKIGELIDKRIEFKDEILVSLLDRLKQDENNLYEYRNNDGTQNAKSFKDHFLIDECEVAFTLGGLHSINSCGTYESDATGKIVDIDFNAFYAEIISNLRLYPPQLGESFCECINDFIRDRKEAAATGDEVVFESMKKALNSVYGLLGYEYKPLCSYKTMYEVTINGQLLLLMLIERLAAYGIMPISICTDGCVLRVKDMAILEAVIKEFQERVCNIGMKIKEFDRIHMLNVNEYIAIDDLGNVKARGSRFRYEADPRKDMSFKVIAKALEAYFVKREDYRTFILNHDSIFDFCGKMKFDSKYIPIMTSLSEYGFEIEEKIEPILRYYISRNTGVIKKRSLKVANNDLYGYQDEIVFKDKNCAVVNYVENKNPKLFDIDYNFYIAETGRIINMIENVQLKLF